MKLNNGSGFSPEEKKAAKQSIYDNINTIVKTLYDASVSMNKPLSEEAVKMWAAAGDFNQATVTSKTLAAEFKVIVNEPSIKECLLLSAQLNVQDTAPYFIQNLDRILAVDYEPTQDDIIKSRQPTKSISETSFIIKKVKVTVYDVGGQKSLRKAWIPFFEGDIKAILFVVSIACYDQKLVEDVEKNRMEDALELYNEIINTELLAKKQVILMLNKTDLFDAKVLTSPIKPHFPDFDGEQTVETSRAFFKAKFEAISDSSM